MSLTMLNSQFFRNTDSIFTFFLIFIYLAIEILEINKWKQTGRVAASKKTS